MKAIIFAAGLGTRLRPLTDNKPKALVEFNGITLLERLIEHLKKFGIREIIINTHHFAAQIAEFIKLKNQFGIRIEISFEDKILDTGGGLKKAAWFFNDGHPFLVHNVDVLTGLDYRQLLQVHRGTNALATLALRRRDSSRYFLLDKNLNLCGWESLSTGEKKIVIPNESLNRFSFMGIHIISPTIFKYFPEQDVFSIVQMYLDMAGQGHKIMGYDASETKWLDVGRIEQLQQAQEIFP